MTNTPETRSGDRWLAGLVVFLIAIVMAACFIGWTAISRQAHATCYQLANVEQAIDEAKDKGAGEQDPQVVRLRTYASGLRAIVPNCPRPQRKE